MNPIRNRICNCQGWRWFWGAGWLLAALLSCWAVPRIYHRLARPAALEWSQVLTDKKREASLAWRDPRPLFILAGDSHIELGNWYDLFSGAWAVRNCGLSQAKIADVTQVISAIGDAHPKMVILLCGINNLGSHESPDACLRDYEALLAAVRLHLQPESTLVLSVMPVRESGGSGNHQFNLDVSQFNARLAACCRQHQAGFLDLNSAVVDARGGLAEELTVDGLHLNREGYRRLAQFIAPHLTTTIP